MLLCLLVSVILCVEVCALLFICGCVSAYVCIVDAYVRVCFVSFIPYNFPALLVELIEAESSDKISVMAYH